VSGPSLLGTVLDGRFRIEGLLGQGAMGNVYRATQLPIDRLVAVKVLDGRQGPGRDEGFRRRFLLEAAMTARLTHPNTVRVLDYGHTSEGLFYIAMEYLAGENLELLLERGPWPWRRVLGLGQQLARSLKEAHLLGVVHRDLKPGNVIRLDAGDGTDHFKVVDFGLVKSFVEDQDLGGRAVTEQGMVMGSPPYMAPEQAERNRADPRSDIYSLGVVLYEALCGRVPFGGSAPMEILLKHLQAPLPPLRPPPGLGPIPEAMVALVRRCLAKSPMDRFQSMDELLRAMQSVDPANSEAALTEAIDLGATPAELERSGEPRAAAPSLWPDRWPLALALLISVAVAVGWGVTRLARPAQPALPAPAATSPAQPPRPGR